MRVAIHEGTHPGFLTGQAVGGQLWARPFKLDAAGPLGAGAEYWRLDGLTVSWMTEPLSP